MTQSPLLRLWAWPIVMAVLTATGLVSALVSDHYGDWWSWLGLGVPVAVMVWFACFAKPKPAPDMPPQPLSKKPPSRSKPR